MKSWYQIKNKSGEVLDISLHDEISKYGFSVDDFKKELSGYENIKSINLSIHSPGGNLLDGLSMYNILKDHPAKVFGKVDGVAASAASTVLMSADVIAMPENAYIMIHNPHGAVIGDSDALREYADLMDKFKHNVINIYIERTGLEYDEVSEMMNTETWMDGKESIEKGFADTLTDSIKIAAKASQFSDNFKSMPIESSESIEKIETLKDFERYLRDSGGISRKAATNLTSRAKVIFQSESEQLPDADYSELETALMHFKIPESLT